MFYDPRRELAPAPLRHNPINTLVAPRPIGWISTVSADGVPNLAPYSYFNAVSADPPVVVFAPNAKEDGGFKDSYRNLLEVPEFVVSIVSAPLAAAMNETSATFEYGIDEFAAVGIAAAASQGVRPPRVAAAPAALECRVFARLDLPAGRAGRRSQLVVGEVTGIWIDDAVIRDGAVDQLALAQVARLGRNDYTTVERLFEMKRPAAPTRRREP
jgi:flavin reductase (DIM6/NTAB) family NADH-FMN oxidoreductase RutF